MMIDDVLELFTEFMREGGRARNLLSRRVMSPRRGGMERCVTDIGKGSTLLAWKSWKAFEGPPGGEGDVCGGRSVRQRWRARRTQRKDDEH